ncbi:hypothetical protein XSR1_40080 [Xenorhabdus szentirmaii DSM 16338]|uniref:Uncharacterized protein n=1 Tax=Xenorhabdus szentirmaii DSM 16338 TaxID=1427518 RepID=W1J3L3_9GAMM|nr:hypothetical protein XSR1_40080 [Xenorhabdus szentirmaii DSM 16338]
MLLKRMAEVRVINYWLYISMLYYGVKRRIRLNEDSHYIIVQFPM